MAVQRGEEWDGSALPAVRGAEKTARRVLKGQRTAAFTSHPLQQVGNLKVFVLEGLTACSSSAEVSVSSHL